MNKEQLNKIKEMTNQEFWNYANKIPFEVLTNASLYSRLYRLAYTFDESENFIYGKIKRIENREIILR